MKTLFMFFGLMAAFTAIFLSAAQLSERNFIIDAGHREEAVSPEFTWQQVAPPGSGTHQYEWKPGTYPSGLVPLVGFGDDLWMIGQKKSWSSKDGIVWKDFDKNDWGERISMASVFFKDRFWVSGGMDYPTNTFLNEIWSSSDGKTWERTVKNAEWSPRKGHTVIAFKNRLWLIGGAVGVDTKKVANKFTNDIWSSADGIHWRRVVDSAPWVAGDGQKIVIFKDALWLIGGQGHSDIWRSDDGKHWTQLKTGSPWKDRFDYGVAILHDRIWVYGGSEYNRHNAYRDVWFSNNGIDWRLQTQNAPWTARSGGNSGVFNNMLLLYGGKHTGHSDSFSGDIWAMSVNLK